MVSLNRDGSEDLGVMQVNTRWLGSLSRYTGLDPVVVRERLLSDACFNITAAALILQTYWVGAHGDLMRAVGNYHSTHHTAAHGVSGASGPLGDGAVRSENGPGAPPTGSAGLETV